MESTNEPTWHTRAQVAEMLGVTMRTVNRDMVNGRLWYRRVPETGRPLIRSDSPRIIHPEHRKGCLCEGCQRPNPESQN